MPWPDRQQLDTAAAVAAAVCTAFNNTYNMACTCLQCQGIPAMHDLLSRSATHAGLLLQLDVMALMSPQMRQRAPPWPQSTSDPVMSDLISVLTAGRCEDKDRSKVGQLVHMCDAEWGWDDGCRQRLKG
jgi:hypothetical protein